MLLFLIRSCLLALIIAGLLPVAGCLPRPGSPGLVVGELHGDMVWEGEILVGGDVTLVADARLTIRPGTVVRFAAQGSFTGGEDDHPHFPGSELNVEGVLLAMGTAAQPIIFAAADESAPPGSWGAVNFAERSAGIFRYCVFRQADSAIHSREATVAVSESLFEDNLVAIRFHTSDMLIEHNLLRGNGTGLRFHFGSPVVNLNRFDGNRTNLFITAHPRDYLIVNNRFGTPLEYHVVLGEEVPENVHLANNDWDGQPAAEVLEHVFDGRRASYLGTVEVEPTKSLPPAEEGPSWIR